MIVPRNCNHCNREYMAETRELNRGNGIYCSRRCSTDARLASLQPPEPNEACAYCNTEIYVTQGRRDRSKSGLFFCSRNHQVLGFSDPNVAVRPGPSPTSSTRKPCLGECGRKTRNGLCVSCKSVADKSAWLAGDVTKSWISTTREPRNFVKAYLIETRGDKCEECGYDKKRPDGSSKIQMDHIDGDYTNNLLENLKLLCPNCHEDTPTFGSRNSGGGRRYRLASTLNRILD